ncbi:MAG: Chemotaxis regulator - transmits chemoreceptor signals to flagelllar motor component CheY [Myxococcales bacterium]|nr:Chemotaxis regulator - transmits chemoreceptor signals to flagelllar motor component CheY [Myxococcales bacterium]
MTKTNVLTVDDSAEILDVLVEYIERPDLEILKASSAAEALALLPGRDVAVALLDVQMPEMDGFGLAEAMRADPRHSHIPIIFLTSGTHDQSRLFRGYDSGAVDFLYKPVEQRVLRGKVDVFVQLHRQRAQLAEQVEVLTQTIRLNEALVAILGHDLRGPLGGVLRGLDALFEKPDPKRTEQIAADLRSTIQRLTRLIDQLLAFTRSRAGKIELRPVSTNIAGLVGRILHEAEETRADFRIETVGDASGTWDPDRLMQAIANLFENARRHRDEGTLIRVDVDGRDAARVVLSVQNEGTIPAEDLPHVFEPFRRSHDPVEGGASGLGLGLYVVKQMVEAHGGSVSLRSTPENGTQFDVEIPRVVA